MPTKPAPRMLHVLVVARSRETIDGLHAYLGGAGVESHGTRTLADVGAPPAATTAVVVFPDDFEVTAVVPVLRSLRAARPRLRIVLVTGAPQRFQPALAPDSRSIPPIVLPRPAFGWTILDAVRIPTVRNLPEP